MSETGRITVDPAQCGGHPCLRGRRIRFKDVLDLLATGAGREEILDDYPLLEEGDITAALEYAARQSDHPAPRVACCASSWTPNRRRNRCSRRSKSSAPA